MTASWQVIRHYGSVHVVPLVDKRFHTLPMCWCKPKRETQFRYRVGAVLYAHNALDGRT